MIEKLKAALRPPSAGWTGPFLLSFAFLAPILLALGWGGGLMRWDPQFDVTMIRLALIAIVVPALGEELLFRAAVLPRPDDGALPLVPTALSIALFVLWHPIQAPIYGGEFGAMMLNPWFLACVAVVGFACAQLYWKTRSIWPVVLLHWSVIMLWKALLDGPSPWS